MVGGDGFVKDADFEGFPLLKWAGKNEVDLLGGLSDRNSWEFLAVGDLPLLLEELDRRASYLALDDLVSGDPYLFIREAYVQRRNYLVNDGQIEDEFGGF